LSLVFGYGHACRSGWGAKNIDTKEPGGGGKMLTVVGRGHNKLGKYTATAGREGGGIKRRARHLCALSWTFKLFAKEKPEVDPKKCSCGGAGRCGLLRT